MVQENVSVVKTVIVTTLAHSRIGKPMFGGVMSCCVLWCRQCLWLRWSVEDVLCAVSLSGVKKDAFRGNAQKFACGAQTRSGPALMIFTFILNPPFTIDKLAAEKHRTSQTGGP